MTAILRNSVALVFLASPVLVNPVLAADAELTVFDWAGFEEPVLFSAYVDQHGDTPTFAFYGDDDEAFQKLASGFKADVAHPCSQMVSKYRDAGLIEPWDISRIPNFDKIDPKFLESTVFKDDQGVWYIPTDWGATAIAYNKDTVPAEDISTLQVFVDPKYQGRTSLPDSSDDVWALAYLATGVTDWTKVSDEQFATAADWMRKAHQNVASYWTDPASLNQLMASGAVDIAWSWNDSPTQLRAENFPVGFNRTPEGGSSTFFCGFVNLKDGPGSEDKTYDFINAWLQPAAAPGLLSVVGYGHSSTEAMKEISAEEQDEFGISPIDGPILAQTPNDPAQREKQLSEFEKIKAGF